MFHRIIALLFIITISFSSNSPAQIVQPFPDGGPYRPDEEVDIDMYLCSWKDSLPRQTHGNLLERDILIRGNSLNPSRKGAVLNYINHFSCATLESRASTALTALKGEQEIFYIISGEGRIEAGNKNANLYNDVAVFVPEGLEFTITNTGKEPLIMYLVNEPVPESFIPIKEILVRDEKSIPYISIGGHWCHKVKQLFVRSDGLAEIDHVLTVSFDPLTIGHPHIYPAGQLEVWTALKETTTAWIGKQIRIQPPGTAYMVPPDGKISHSNINSSHEEAKFFYFFRFPEQDSDK